MAEREAVTEVLTYWEQKGLEQGLEQGLKQGLKQGLYEAITLQVKERFGESVESKRLDSLSLEALRRLMVAIVRVNTYQEWLVCLELSESPEESQS